VSNERLRAAIHQAGLEVDEVAYKIEVDTRTVRRWLAGRTPRGLYRTRLAETLGTTEAELWPELDLRVEGRDEQGEILAAYAHANDLAAPDWRALLTAATGQVELLDLTLADVLSSAGTAELLAEKAAAGCEVRLLISAPDSAYLALTDVEQGHDITLLDLPPSAEQAERSIHTAEALASAGTVQARTFLAARFNTILRFDDEMLVTLHLYATPSGRAPLLHLKRHSDHGLFEQFASHFDTLWQDAQPITAPPDQYRPSPPPASAG
jgi:transcriptional regulator with XRE-family HTH domain